MFVKNKKITEKIAAALRHLFIIPPPFGGANIRRTVVYQPYFTYLR